MNSTTTTSSTVTLLANQQETHSQPDNALPSHTTSSDIITSSAFESTTKDCPICMEEIDTKVNYVITECGHMFHTKCLLTNVAHNGFGCPYCRKEMIDEEEHDDDSETEEHGDALNTGFFIEDEDDDDDADSWHPGDDDDVEHSQNEISRNAFLGMRRMFAMAEGEEDDEDQESEENSDDSESSTSESSSSAEDDASEEDEELQRRRQRHVMRTDLRITATELRLEENRLFNNVLPNINYITQRITSSAYGDMSFEELTTALLRLTMWREYPQYERMIGNRVSRRLDHNLWMTLNQIIEGYQAYDHDDLVEEARNEIDQSIDMGMD